MAGAASWPANTGAKNPCSRPTCWSFCPQPSTRFVLRVETHSAEETREVGRQLSRLLPEHGVVLLIGELGAGKTTLTKGIAEGRGAARAEDVASPTFTLIHEYGDPVSVYHVDLYRLETVEEARRLGLEDMFHSPALVLVEWGDRFPGLFPPDRVEIRLHHAGEDARIIDYGPPQ